MGGDSQTDVLQAVQQHVLSSEASTANDGQHSTVTDLYVDLDLWNLPTARAAAEWINRSSSPPSPRATQVVHSLVLERGDPTQFTGTSARDDDDIPRHVAVADVLLASLGPSLIHLETDLLTPSVCQASHLQSLSVDLSSLSSASWEVLHRLLQGPKLKEVTLRGERETPSYSSTALFNLLRSLSHHPLERLELQLPFDIHPQHPMWLPDEVGRLLQSAEQSLLQLSLEHTGGGRCRRGTWSDWSCLEAAPFLQCVHLAGWSFPEYAYDFAPWEGPHLTFLQLTDCTFVDFGPLSHLRTLEELRMTSCNVSAVDSTEWTSWLSRLGALQRLCLESLDLENVALQAIAKECGRWDALSLGPIYNARQTYSGLGEVVRNARGTLHLYGGGPLDCNLIHVARGLGSTRVQYLTVENYACSKETFAVLFRKLYQCGSAGSLQSFALSLVGSPHMDLLPVVALLQANPPHLRSLSLNPPLVVRPEWAATLERAAHLNTTLETFHGLECSHLPHACLNGALSLLWQLNRCGRRVLQTPNAFPLALWPRLLTRAVGAVAAPAAAADPSPATITYFFLRHLPRIPR